MAPDGWRRQTASGGRWLRTASSRLGNRPPPSDGLGGWPQRPPDGHSFRWSKGGRPLYSPVAAADGWLTTSPSAWWTAAKADVRGVVGCIRTSGGCGRGHPDAWQPWSVRLHGIHILVIENENMLFTHRFNNPRVIFGIILEFQKRGRSNNCFHFLSTYYYIPITSTSYFQIIAYLLKIWSIGFSNIYPLLHCLPNYEVYYKLVQYYKSNNIYGTIHYDQINNILSSNAYVLLELNAI
jgi:hypothetical protein